MAARHPATQLSLRWAESNGYDLVEVVERKVPSVPGRPMTTRDLFNIGDILCVRADPAETLILQTTSAGGFYDRKTRLINNPATRILLRAGWRVMLHGWSQKAPRARWELKKKLELVLPADLDTATTEEATGT